MRIIQGDVKPDLYVTLTDDGRPLTGLRSLTTAVSVTVVGSMNGTELFRRPASMVDDAGNVRMGWETTDTATVGFIDIQVEVMWTDGLQTFEPTGRVEVAPVYRARLVTVEDLSNHMSGVTFDTAQEADADAVLRGLERGLERRLKRRFTPAEVTEAAFADEAGYAMLARSPVHSITAVTSQYGYGYGIPAGGTGYGVAPRRNGLVGLAPLTWATVTYVGGGLDDDELEDVKLAVLEKASAIMTNRHDDTRSVKALDTREPTTNPNPTMQWTDDELTQFGNLRRIVVI